MVDEGFELVERRKGRRKPPVVVGSKENSALQGVSTHLRYLFVTRLHPDTTARQIGEYLEEQKS